MLVPVPAVLGSFREVTGRGSADNPTSRGGTDAASILFVGVLKGRGDRLPTVLPPSTSKAWQMRDTSQERERPSQM